MILQISTAQSLPFQGRWLGAAETERSLQICDNLSVSLRLPAPLKGEPWMVRSVGAGRTKTPAR